MARRGYWILDLATAMLALDGTHLTRCVVLHT